MTKTKNITCGQQLTSPQPMPNLMSHHYVWFVKWALEKCAEETEKAEAQVSRLSHPLFSSEPDVYPHSVLPRNRAQRVTELMKFIRQYREIQKFGELLLSRLEGRTAEEFAETMKAYFRSKVT
jgi:hypothetical protein